MRPLGHASPTRGEKRGRRWPVLALALLAFAATPASADSSEVPQRSSELVVYGSDPCPKTNEDEIVVCHRRPESERYRIPKQFRNPPRHDTGSMAWGQQERMMEDATRFTRPDSCSVVGTGGQTGCFNAMMRQWWLERRAGY